MNAGDQGATQNVRELLDTQPIIWKRGGDLAKVAELALIKTIAEKNKLAVGMFSRYVDSLKREIAGSAPTPLERLAAERVVQCWLQVQHVDMACADINMPLTQMRFWANRQDAAHRRFISAVKALTMVRTLLPAAAGRDAGPTAQLPQPQPTTAIPATADDSSDSGQKHLQAVAATGQDVPSGEPLSANGKQKENRGERPGKMSGKPVNRIVPLLQPVEAK